MYSDNDLNDAQRAVQRARLLMFLPAAVLLAGAIVSFIFRIKWLTILLSILGGSWMVFSHQLFVIPRRGYMEHVRSALRVARKVAEGYYLRMEETPVERNNVMFYAFYLNVGEKQDPEDDRLFYFDARRPLPDWKTGDRILIRSYDKFVSSWEILAKAEPASSNT